MKKIAAILAVVLLSSCQVFLGSDPDDSPRGIFDRIWTDFDETYALMDVKGINWNDVYNTYSPQIASGMGERRLFEVCAAMLETLKDAHVYFMSPFAYSNSGGRFDAANKEPFSLEVVKTYLTNGGAVAGDGMFLYGTFSSKQDVGYIYIAGFALGATGIAQSQDWAEAIDGVVQSLAHTNSLVLDLRGNTGGLLSNVNYIASRFASAHKDYAEVRTKNGSGRHDFSAPITNDITPAGSRYTKPIVLLTNKQTISGGEWFTLALRSQGHVTHVGGTTHGAFSLSLERSLINGWIYSVSVQKVTDMAGVCYEGIGISPEHEVANTEEDLASDVDKQLEHAMGLL
jgi:C-terminal processing protease CtpA/Prc